MKNKLNLYLLVGILGALVGALPAAARTPKALVFMLDGTRPDALDSWAAPTVHQLREGKWQPGYKCAWSLNARTIYDAAPNSGPNHVSIATGVTYAQHKVSGNVQSEMEAVDYATYPTWLKRVVTADSTRKALFVYKWDYDSSIGSGDGIPTYNGGTEALNLARVLEELNSSTGADAILYYIDAPDGTGHSTGFYSLNDTYLTTIQTCDNTIKQCLAAIAARPTFADEDWLIAITTDHGGIDKNHGYWGGMCENIPVVITSRSVPHGRIKGTPYHMIATSTALDHFGIDTSSFVQAPLTADLVEDPLARPLSSGLDYYVTFDDDSTVTNEIDNGKTVAFDQGMGTSTLGATGRFGKCFTATTRGLALVGTKNHAFTNGTDFCLTMWAKIPSNITSDPCLFGDKNWNKGTNNGFALIANGQKGSAGSNGIFFNFRQTSGRYDMGTLYQSLGAWAFVAVVRDGNEILVYKGRPDGTLEWMGRLADSFVWGGYDFHVGQDGTGTYGVSLLGTGIDDVGFWSRALNVQELRRIYLAGLHGRSLGDLLASESESRTLTVTSVEDTTVNLAFAGASTRTYALCLASGATDGADDKYAWSDFTVLGTVAPGVTNGTYTLPESWQMASAPVDYRFFLLQTNDLPYAQELEFVKSDGTAYIKTDITAYTPYTRVETDLLAPTQNGNWMWMFGAYSTANTSKPKTGNFSVARHAAYNDFYFEITGANSESCTFALNTRYHVSFEPTTLTVNGTSYATGQTRSGFTTNTYPVTLFRTLKNGTEEYDQTFNGRIYNFKAYDGERLVNDLVPAKNADGTIGFADVLLNKFYTNAATSGSFTAGEHDATIEAARRGIVRDQSVTLVYQPPTTPVIAVWTGAGTDATVYSDPANWSCTNTLGVYISDAVPTADTESILLAADADWRVLGTNPVLTAAIDLQGHTLTLAGLTGTGRVTDSTTDPAQPGTLRVEVAEGATVVNSGVSLLGNLAFVKEGAGTLQLTKTGANYTGGTRIAAGTLKAPNTTYPCHDTNDVVTVDAEATLDINQTAAGNGASADCLYVLNGGTIVNTGSYATSWQATDQGLGHVRLTADSSVRPGKAFGFQNRRTGASTLDMNGHTLTLDTGTGECYLYNLAVTNGGTVVVASAGTITLALGNGLQAPTTSFDFAAPFGVYKPDTGADHTISNLTVRTASTSTASAAGTLDVTGVYKPVTDYINRIQLMNGATIDLTEKTAAFNTTSSLTGQTLAYATNAAITVDLHGRTLTPYEQILAWTGQPTQVEFAWDAVTAASDYAPVLATTGLFYGTDPASRIVDKAVWTGAAGNGDVADTANWACTNMAGRVVTNAVPGTAAAVTIAGENINLQLASSDALAYATLTLGDCTLGADCDWRGLTNNIPSRIDLNGHKLTVSKIQGSGEITDNLLRNGGFEKFSGTATTWAAYFSDSLVPVAWTGEDLYIGFGLTVMGTSWVNAGDIHPQGSYALFIDGAGRTIQQTVTVKKPGAHTLVFYAAGRPSYLGLAVLVKIDGETVARHVCDHTTWTRVTTALDLAAGEHVVTITAETTDGAAANAAAALDSVLLSPVGSSLHVDVPEGTTTVDQPFLEISGAFSLYKEGKGSLRMQGGAHGYLGNEVLAGTMFLGATLSRSLLGVTGDTEIGVAPGATFGLGGRCFYSRYIIRLDGGTLVNEAVSNGPSDYDIVLNRVRLTADSAFTFSTMSTSHDVFLQDGALWDFGGHTLTMTMQGKDPDFGASDGSAVSGVTVTFRNGTLKIPPAACYFQDYGIRGGDNFTLDYGGNLRLRNNSTLFNFINRSEYGSVASASGKLLTILGTYTPLSVYGVNTQMADGSTIDLSSKTDTWSTSVTNVSGDVNCAVTFADNAKVTIDVHGRTLTNNQQIVSWTTPTNLTTLAFKLDEATRARGYGCVANEDGLFVVKANLMIIIR